MNPFDLLMRETFRLLEPAERDLSPPEPTHAEKLASWELEERKLEAYERSMRATLQGKGDFWPSGNFVTVADYPKWDNEQWMPVFAALRRAYAAIGLTDAQRWQVVAAAVAEEAAKLAEHEAERVLP